ncbi:hypothetical protein AAGO23_10535 [Klebsiella pneumoniae]|nr:hypothetical protein [Klebsiella pneumoniae]
MDNGIDWFFNFLYVDWAEKANKTEQRDNKDERGALPGDRVQHS